MLTSNKDNNNNILHLIKNDSVTDNINKFYKILTLEIVAISRLFTDIPGMSQKSKI